LVKYDSDDEELDDGETDEGLIVEDDIGIV
jgi:hypothetical protein